MSYSINNRLITEVYKKEGLKSSVNNGFAMVSQKVSVKGLKILTDAVLSDGSKIAVGSVAYIREETLHTHPSLKSVFESDAIGQPFMIVDLSLVDFIEEVK